jgi:hypothetical protein
MKMNFIIIAKQSAIDKGIDCGKIMKEMIMHVYGKKAGGNKRYAECTVEINEENNY